MHLIDLCHDIIEIPAEIQKIVVTGLAVDSNRVIAGNLFFAITGNHHDGRDFVGEAITAGAIGVVTGREPLTNHVVVLMRGTNIPVIHCDNPRHIMAKMAARRTEGER